MRFFKQGIPFSFSPSILFVQGTALEALSAMDGFLRSRPKAFKSIEEAIEWRFVGYFRVEE